MKNIKYISIGLFVIVLFLVLEFFLFYWFGGIDEYKEIIVFVIITNITTMILGLIYKMVFKNSILNENYLLSMIVVMVVDVIMYSVINQFAFAEEKILFRAIVIVSIVNGIISVILELKNEIKEKDVLALMEKFRKKEKIKRT